MRRFVAALFSTAFLLPIARADVKLPAVISDHGVLQRDATVPIWGWAEPNEEVSVSLAGQTKQTKAGADGAWKVAFDKLPAGDALTLQVKGKNAITVNDLLVGEVWLCSGQSNMGMTVSGSKDFDKEQPAAKFPQLRHYRESSAAAAEPQKVGAGKWEVCAPDKVGSFSATAYFFGRGVHQALNVPVGIINSSVGGTPIEAWTSWPVQKDQTPLKPLFEQWDKKAATFDMKQATEKFEQELAKWKDDAAKAKAAGQQAPRAPQKPVLPTLDTHHPATLFNGKINPLIPYAIRGAIWYQGESNANNLAANYGLQLRLLIEDWRARWGEGNFPFAWVQLPNFHKPQTQPVEEGGWVTVRDEMTKTLSLPNTGMAITIDVGEAGDVHPKNKQDVGKRLAQWALADVYQQKGVVASGPLYSGHEILNGEVIVSFKYAAGLTAKNGEPKGFAIAGADKKWVWANARIDGDKVIISSPDVKEPVAVRYAWADNPVATLYNGAGIPAGPFRTDGAK